MNRPAWANVALFAITQRHGWSVIAAAIILFIWWNFADFFVAQRLQEAPQISDLLLVALAAIFVLSPLVVLTRAEIRRGLRQYAVRDSGAALPADPATLAAMLSVIAENCQGLARQYTTWLRDRKSGWKTWLPAGWFFTLLIFLALPPLHSEVMETVFGYMGRVPASIIWQQVDARAGDMVFNVHAQVKKWVTPQQGDAASSGVPTIKKPYLYRMTTAESGWERNNDFLASAGIGGDTAILFHAGDFPHVHRRVDVKCARPNCVAVNAPGVSPVRVPLRGGVGEFEYTQEGERLTRLRVTAILCTYFGRRLHKTEIEPK